MDQARLARLILQNAESSRLLGVDFVPAYRRGTAAEGSEPGREAADEDALGDSAGARSAPLSSDSPPVVHVVQDRPPVPRRPGAVAGAVMSSPPRKAVGGDVKGGAALNGPAFDCTPIERTREAVALALAAIRERYDLDCPHQHFVTAHNMIVFGEGDPLARLMFIGEAPGAEEDKCGRPFVGRAGQLLQKMIEAMGLTREDVYISNVLKTRPPDNATPTSDEIRICAPYLYQQIAVIQPEVIVTLGLPATKAILNSAEPMSRLRGRWFEFQPPAPALRAVAVMPTYHPAYLLRAYTAENRAKVWSDLQQVMQRLGMAT
jgi:uracil-DNA glycosylase